MKVREILISLLQTIRDRPQSTDERAHPLLLLVYNWLFHLTQKDAVRQDPGLCFGDVIYEKIETFDPLVRRWFQLMLGGEASLTTLLYRHYLFAALSREEIFPKVDYPPLYLLVGSMLYQEVRFSPLDGRTIWEELEHAHPLINTLRHYRPRIQEYATALAYRMDVTEQRLDKDHGLLATHTLLYGLSLTRVIVTFEQTVRPSPGLEAVLSGLTMAFARMKGVLFHGEN